ncbi:MAG: amino acid ABC transporter substrate-binding protein, partial [Propionibacteriaceae bacterium]
GVARAFADNAKKNGIEVVGTAHWDAKQPNYTALYQAVKASGADLVYLGGIYDNNGGQLVKDKVAVLGPNDGAVKLFAPDGFTGYPDLLKLDESKGMYLTFAGLTQDQLAAAGGVGAKLLTDYQTKYGKAPDGSYPLYGVAATQVILDAIAKSDGSRKSVTEQVLGGAGITIPADKSVLGKEIKIDPTTGDTSAKDLTIEIIKDGKEIFEKSQSIS